METRVLVRVQAKGGKFIGPDGGYSLVTLREVVTGEILAQRIATGGSGNLSTTFTPGASREVIVTPRAAGDTVQWLSAPAGQSTAGLLATLDLHRPTLVEFSATTLSDGIPNGHGVKQQMWLTPGVHLDREPGVVLVIPGLNVQILAPDVAAVPAGSVTVTAWVAMMCGCKIADTPTSAWLPEEFRVHARLRAVGGDFTAEAPLTFQATSTFGTDAPIALPPGAGNYELVVDAVQAAEGNVGSASYFFAATGSPDACDA
ncbi:MAG TPA: hypothetical protein VEQ60_24605 [Longimicrobium sp.]|nr:hypothetical protein [Longimicrobium sp.]